MNVALARRLGWIVCSLLLASTSAVALELPDVLGSHMVLQRQRAVPIWGKAEPGAAVTVTFGDAEVTATADDAGDWQVEIETGEASAEGRTLTVSEAGGETVELVDVLVGEVWQCSGQSNMGWSVRQSNNPDEEIAAADYPQIRLFNHPRVSVPEPRFTAGGQWRVCSPETVGGFSAVGYYFGRKLHEDLGVPIGLVATPWGGASAEAFVSRETLMESDASRRYVEQFDEEQAELERRLASGDAVDPSTLPERHPEPVMDQDEMTWAGLLFDDSDWPTIDPVMWEQTELGNIDGVVWYRKTVELPAAMRGKELTLNLGAIDDADKTFVNGMPVGETTVNTPDSWQIEREYAVPAELTETDELVIAVRVFDHYGGGGMHGSGLRSLTTAEGDRSQPIAGKWRVKVRHELSPNDLRGSSERMGRSPQHKPAFLWNGMIQPVAPFAQRGVIWYQGESNAGRADSYDKLMRDLIDDWRALWGQPAEHRGFPFIAVQLANFTAPVTDPNQEGWGKVRQAQFDTAANHPDTYLATAVDIGEADDIHPRNKQEVGRRLALIAERRVYGMEGFMDQGPTFAEMRSTSRDEHGHERMRLSFDYAEGLTMSDGQPPRGLAVRQGDGEPWRWAVMAEVSGEELLVSAPAEIEAPFDVRYGWGMNPTDGPHGANLVNGEGLPMFPFEAIADDD